MPTKYLLPCSCGLDVEVEIGQAGTTVSCACGNQLTVPTMRGLRALRTMEAADDGPRSAVEGGAWGPRQGLILLGLVIAVIGGVTAAVFYVRLPEKPDIDVATIVRLNQEAIDQLSLSDTFAFWSKEIAGRGLNLPPPPQMVEYNHIYNIRHRWMTMFLIVAGAGVILALGGLAVPNTTQRRPQA